MPTSFKRIAAALGAAALFTGVYGPAEAASGSWYTASGRNGDWSVPSVPTYAQGCLYTVKKGDSLWLIAKNHKTTVPALMRANRLTSTVIYPGQSLVIPSGPAAPAAANPQTPVAPSRPEAPAANGLQQPADSNYPQQVWQILESVNGERSKNGLAPLTIDPLLQKGAMLKAKDMRDRHYFGHQSPTYGSPFDMMKSLGIRYSYAGENIAAGQATAREVMKAWMSSPGHRANILNSQYTKIGIGYVTGGDYGTYWTQEFIRP